MFTLNEIDIKHMKILENGRNERTLQIYLGAHRALKLAGLKQASDRYQSIVEEISNNQNLIVCPENDEFLLVIGLPKLVMKYGVQLSEIPTLTQLGRILAYSDMWAREYSEQQQTIRLLTLWLDKSFRVHRNSDDVNSDIENRLTLNILEQRCLGNIDACWQNWFSHNTDTLGKLDCRFTLTESMQLAVKAFSLGIGFLHGLEWLVTQPSKNDIAVLIYGILSS